MIVIEIQLNNRQSNQNNEINVNETEPMFMMFYYCRIKCIRGNHLYFFAELIVREISISAIVVKILHLACYQMATRCFLEALAANFSVLTISPDENFTPSLRKLIGYFDSRLFPRPNISI